MQGFIDMPNSILMLPEPQIDQNVMFVTISIVVFFNIYIIFVIFS